jgi:hypothetical protein
MQLKYVGSSPSETPIICIYDCGQQDLSELRERIHRLSKGETKVVRVDELAGKGARSAVALRAVATDFSEGVSRLTGSLQFEWSLCKSDWELVDGLLDGLIGSPVGSYQWLAGTEARYGLEISPIDLVVTTADRAEW